MEGVIRLDDSREEHVKSWRFALGKLGSGAVVLPVGKELLHRKRPRLEAPQDGVGEKQTWAMALPPASLTPSKSSKVFPQTPASSPGQGWMPSVAEQKEASWIRGRFSRFSHTAKLTSPSSLTRASCPKETNCSADDLPSVCTSPRPTLRNLRRRASSVGSTTLEDGPNGNVSHGPSPARPRRRASSVGSTAFDCQVAVETVKEDVEVVDDATPQRVRSLRSKVSGARESIHGSNRQATATGLCRSPSGPMSLYCPSSSLGFELRRASASGKRGDHRLNVAIFNACAPDQAVHPAAMSCRAALVDTPWFHSHAVEWLLGDILAAGGSSTVWTPPVVVDIVSSDEIRVGRLVNGPPPPGAQAHRTRNDDASEADMGNVAAFDVLIVPGGSAATDSQLLGSLGLENIRSFVLGGGSYLGICAGAFLALTYHDSKGSLGLVNAYAGMKDGTLRTTVQAEPPSDSVPERIVDEEASPQTPKRDEYRTAPPQEIDMRFTALGRRQLWDEGRNAAQEPLEREGGTVSVRYSNGPLMTVAANSCAKVLATAVPCDMDKRLSDDLPRTAVMLMEDVGEGRAVLISPHPESTQSLSRHVPTGGNRAQPGKARLRRILQRAVLLAAAGSSSKRWLEEACRVPVWRMAPPMPSE